VCTNTQTCKQCLPEAYRHNLACLTTCPQGFYGSNLIKTCEKCLGECPPRLYNLSVTLIREYVDQIMSIIEVPQTVVPYLESALINNSLIINQLKFNNTFLNYTPTQVEYSGGLLKVVTRVANLPLFQSKDIEFLNFLNAPRVFPEKATLVHFTNTSFKVPELESEKVRLLAIQVMASLLSGLVLLLTVVHYLLFRESNGLAEALVMVSVMFTFSVYAKTECYSLLEGLLILSLNFAINFGSSPIFYKYSNLLFISRNNLLFVNGIILLVFNIVAPLLMMAGNSLLGRKKLAQRFAYFYLGTQQQSLSKDRALADLASPLRLGVHILEGLFQVFRVAILLSCVTYFVWVNNRQYNLVEVMGFVLAAGFLAVDLLLSVVNVRAIFQEESSLLILLRNSCLYSFGLLVCLFTFNLP
jgi:hypothetical protein